MSLELVPVRSDQLEASRHLWFPFVAAIAKRQRCYMEQRLADIYSGNVALILVWDNEAKQARAIIGYSILQRGADRALKLIWATGDDRPEWLGLYAQLERWAIDAGCKSISAVARPGWSKDLKEWGYKLTHVEYEKEL